VRGARWGSEGCEVGVGVNEAAEKWGTFGKKKRWMDAHPGASEGEWEKQENGK
jgi:hypothetical protein